eukprot:287204-Hanusia_phi.AAC.2
MSEELEAVRASESEHKDQAERLRRRVKVLEEEKVFSPSLVRSDGAAAGVGASYGQRQTSKCSERRVPSAARASSSLSLRTHTLPSCPSSSISPSSLPPLSLRLFAPFLRTPSLLDIFGSQDSPDLPRGKSPVGMASGFSSMAQEAEEGAKRSSRGGKLGGAGDQRMVGGEELMKLLEKVARETFML